ncbi:MAG: ABC transporter substrate-binding protein [Alkalispirochaeta sp.]
MRVLKRYISLVLLVGTITYIHATGSPEGGGAVVPDRETVSVTHDLGTVSVPLKPSPIVVFGFDTLDTLNVLGVPVDSVPKANLPKYLNKYAGDDIHDAGTLFEPDFEAIFDVQPEAMFISSRQAGLYDEFARIAPTVYLTVRTGDFMESVRENARLLASLYGKSTEVEKALDDLDNRAAAIRMATKGATALMIMVNDGALSVYGPGSRFDIVYTNLGFTPAHDSIEVSTHGQSISFEYLVEHDADYLIVLDRGAAISGTSTARSVLNNALVRETSAFVNDHIIYASPQAWYLAAGGLEATSTMFSDIESVIGK